MLPSQDRTPSKSKIWPSLCRPRSVGAIAGFTVIAAALAVPQQMPNQQYTPSIGQPRADATTLPDLNRTPDANDRMQMDQRQSKKEKFEAANALRRKQIAADAAQLLQLATELKSEVDKTDKDTLSLQVIRKAESIERLAKGVKEKMKLSAGSS